MPARKITDWRKVALLMYQRLYGCRCVRCSDPVRLPEDGVLYRLNDDIVLTHKKTCGPKR
jgi:hypothetical protein